MNRTRRILANLLLSAAAIVLISIAAELVLRLTYRPVNLSKIVRFDPELGWSLRPNANCRLYDPIVGHEYAVRVNSFGVRDHEFAIEKSPSRRRVLILGDSFAFGPGVENNERFSDFLQRAVGDKAEVINSAVPGWGTDQEVLYFESVSEQLRPDIVILTVTMGNDVINNAIDHLFLGTAPKPRFTWNGQSLQVTNTPLAEAPLNARARLRLLLRKSRLLLFIKRRLDPKLREHVPEKDPVKVPAYLRARDDVFLTHWSVYQRSYDPDFEAAFQITEKLLLRLRDGCRRTGAELLVFAFPSRIEFNDDWRRQLMREEHIDVSELDMTRPFRRLAVFCELNNVAFFFPYQSFKAVGANRSLYFEHDEHPNEFGHALAARLLLDELKRRYDLDYHISPADAGYYDSIHRVSHAVQGSAPGF